MNWQTDSGNQPLVSVLMTSFNREKYIASAIESVLASTYKHFELIISDDASKDRTVEIAGKYAAIDSRVKIFINSANAGDFKNRNIAAGKAVGKYLKYVDADDLIYPWGLELMVGMMERFPEAGWGLCSLEQDDQQPFPFLLHPPEIYEYAYFGPGLFHKSPLSSIINREAFNQCGGFSGKQHLGDFELWHILGGTSPLVLMPHGMVWHRIHEEQQSVDNRTDPTVFFKYTVSSLHFFETEKRIPLSPDKIERVCKRLKKRSVRNILNRMSRLDFKNAGKMYRMYSDPSFNFHWK